MRGGPQTEKAAALSSLATLVGSRRDRGTSRERCFELTILLTRGARGRSEPTRRAKMPKGAVLVPPTWAPPSQGYAVKVAPVERPPPRSPPRGRGALCRLLQAVYGHDVPCAGLARDVVARRGLAAFATALTVGVCVPDGVGISCLHNASGACSGPSRRHFGENSSSPRNTRRDPPPRRRGIPAATRRRDAAESPRGSRGAAATRPSSRRGGTPRGAIRLPAEQCASPRSNTSPRGAIRLPAEQYVSPRSNTSPRLHDLLRAER